PPIVDAGPDAIITLPQNVVVLSGTVSDNGLPLGAPVTQRWSVVSGPGSVQFSAPTSTTTSATFDSPGTYILRLSANDTELEASDDVTITVIGLPPTGDPPTVAITSPGDLTNVTSPTPVRGTVTSGSLLAWRLEYREQSLGDEWRPFARGTTTVTDG